MKFPFVLLMSLWVSLAFSELDCEILAYINRYESISHCLFPLKAIQAGHSCLLGIPYFYLNLLHGRSYDNLLLLGSFQGQ